MYTCFAGKARQDVLKEEKDPAYNPVLRQVNKTYANNLSGKFSEETDKHVTTTFTMETTGQTLGGMNMAVALNTVRRYNELMPFGGITQERSKIPA
jgi:hypothetical protein